MLQQIFGKPDFHGFKKLTDRVYVYLSYVNSTVILADDGVCIIDSQVNTGQLNRLLAEIKKITALPIKWLINTHYHWDHIMGNRILKDQGATLYAHEKTAHFIKTRMKRQCDFLKGRGFTIDETDPALPDKTYTGDMVLNLPGIDLELHHFGAAETDDATAIYLPRENLMVTGDTLLTGSFPIFGMAVVNEGLGEDRSWLRVLEKVRHREAKTLIPGHGPLGNTKDLDLMRDIQSHFLDEVEKYVNQGLSLAEMQKRINRDLPPFIRKLPEVWGTVNYAIYRCYHSFTGWMDYKPSAIPWANEDQLATALSRADNDAPRIEVTIAKALKERNFALALSLCKHLCDQEPDHGHYHALFAESLMEAAQSTSSILEKGDFFALAKNQLEEAFDLNPIDPLAQLVEGMFSIVRAEKNGTNPMQGIALLEKAASSEQLNDARKAKVQFGLCLGYFQTGQMEKAQNACKKALEYDSHFMPAQKLLQEISKRKPSIASE